MLYEDTSLNRELVKHTGKVDYNYYHLIYKISLKICQALYTIII